MPEQRPGIAGWVFLAVVAAALLFALLTHPVMTLVSFGALAAATALMERRRSRHVRNIVAARSDEDIGTFARAFDRRSRDPLDPWAIRAVWNALVPLTESNGRRIPLRPTDRFEDDLTIDPEDIEDMVPLLVEQCERVPGNWNANPYCIRLRTVGDLVHFISAQPSRWSA